MDDIPEIIDRNGEVRRLGSLAPPPGFVSAFKTFEAEHPLWEDADIKLALLAPDRVVSRLKYGAAWRQNQKSKGSCNGYAGAACLARARFQQSSDREPLLLSGAFLYSLINRGQDRGSVLEDGMKAVQEYGCPPEALVPWDQIYPQQQPPNAKAEAAKHKGLECYAVQTKQGLRTALAAGFSVIAAVHVGSRFDTLKNGVCGVDNGPGNHAVCIDGLILRNGSELYDMANSWGLSFGDEGRGYLTWDHFAQTFGQHVFYAIPTMQESA